MNYLEIQDYLSYLLKGDISIADEDRQSHATDWSLFKIVPDMVVYPKNTEDIKKLVEFTQKYHRDYPNGPKISLTARAAGSGMSGGSLNHSIIVDVTRYMNQVSSVELVDLGLQEVRKGFAYQLAGHAVAQPGTKYLDFEEKTLGKGLLMPVFPASRKLCAIGGMVANNGAGEKTLKYGQNKDFVKRLKVILSDAQEYDLRAWNYDELQGVIASGGFLAGVTQQIYALIKENWSLIQEKRPTTSKNSAGYLIWDVIHGVDSITEFESGKGFFDLTKLIVGAQGTTGIMTEIEYALIEEETKEEMIVMFVDDIHDLPRIVQVLQRHDLDTIELYDDHTFKVGVKFFRDFLKDKGFWGGIRYVLRFMPEFFMVLRGGVPKFVVLAESADKDQTQVHREVLAELKDLKHQLPKLKSFMVKGKDSEKYWDFRHDSFKLLTEHSKRSRTAGSGTRTAPFIDDIAVNPEYLPEYIPQLVEILDEYKDFFLYTIAGHLGNGNFHIIPLADMHKPENRENIVTISNRVYELALKYGGTITAEHNDGIIRTPFLKDMFGQEMMGIFQKIKDIFDPLNIFNPGKKVGFTKDDINRYLA